MSHPALAHAVQAVGRLVLGTDNAGRRRTARTLMGLGVYLACVLAERLGAAFALVDPMHAGLAPYFCIGPVIFYLLIRSGWTRRFRDPALSIAQNLYAVNALVLAYPVNGPLRGLSLVLVALVPFFSFLIIPPRTLRWLAFVTLAAFGAMMAFLASTDPERFPPNHELLHFVIAAICLPSMAVVLGLASRMRARVRAQRTELQAALERIEATTTHDELTGLLNRRRMTELLEEEARRHARQPQAMSLALIDIDHFKRINDSLGHAQGDEVLSHFARIAAASLPAGCELARWGGEEFLLLLPGAEAPAAERLVEGIRERLARLGIPGVHVTFSAGVADGPSADTDAVLERADQALYRAKAEGRDRTVTFGVAASLCS